ncbi:MAG: filamentous hemagglutinin N-terminal domain-containing protein, partial [Nitrospirae bacterium]|nr:filamentous hemagglutinin N-terminal domain-containing protein [Nitrospirota bacterium]
MPATSCNVFSGTSAGIARVIGRVTGGEPSSINGTVTVSIAGADLFLINPAGLIFGPNARLNVSGTVRLSTADYLKMADATQFHADLARPTVLSVAAVEAFGFLARPAAQFASVTIDRGSLQVPTGKTIAIVGGNIDIIGPHSNATPALQARSGRIELVSVTSQGEIAATGVVGDAAPAVDAFATLGTVTLSNGARILATPGVGNVTPGGQAMVRAHSMTVDASFIAASTGGNQNAPSVAVDLLVRDLLLLDHGSVISSSNLDRTGTGNAGLVRMKAGRVELVNGSNLTLLYAGNGKGSDLLVEADTVRVTDGGARVFAQNRGDRTSTGSGGTLQFVVGQDMFIGPGSAIRAENLSGSGAGSPIELTAPRLTIEGQFGGTSGAGIIGGTGGFGPASSVVLSVGALELRGGDALINTRASTSSVIGGSTQPQGGGPITVQGLSGAGSAADAVIIRGQGSGFQTETDGSGAGGALQI